VAVRVTDDWEAASGIGLSRSSLFDRDCPRRGGPRQFWRSLPWFERELQMLCRRIVKFRSNLLGFYR